MYRTISKTVSHALLAALLASCALFRPHVPADSQLPPSVPAGASYVVPDSTSGAEPDSCGPVNYGPRPQLSMALPPMPAHLTPREQRRWLRVASRAQARIVRAQPRQVPLIVTTKIKHKDDNRGSNGGTFAPKAKAPIATASGGSSASATQVKPAGTPFWVWFLLLAAGAWLIYRARATR